MYTMHLAICHHMQHFILSNIYVGHVAMAGPTLTTLDLKIKEGVERTNTKLQQQRLT